MEEVLWPSLDKNFIEEYSTFFTSDIQIIIVILVGILFLMVFCIYGLIPVFDLSTKYASPTQYSIHFDPKGFSNNELRLYNIKSVDGGCKLKEINSSSKGHVRISTAEKLFDPPAANDLRIDELLQPLNEGISLAPGFLIIECADFIDDSQMRHEPAEVLPGNNEESIVIPSLLQHREENGKQPPIDNKATNPSDNDKTYKSRKVLHAIPPIKSKSKSYKEVIDNNYRKKHKGGSNNNPKLKKKKSKEPDVISPSQQPQKIKNKELDVIPPPSPTPSQKMKSNEAIVILPSSQPPPSQVTQPTQASSIRGTPPTIIASTRATGDISLVKDLPAANVKPQSIKATKDSIKSYSLK